MKLLRHLRLLRDDPEKFGRNLLQFTNRPLFHERLVDVLYPGPMHVRVAPEQNATSMRLNVLDTAWTKMGMTGGPNTVINLALRVAQHGVRVRLVSTAKPHSMDPAWFAGHAAALLGTTAPDIPFATAADPAAPLDVTPHDVFLATHWATALQLKPVLPLLPIKQFFYMLQEYEAGFYAWSSNFARTIETYGMDFWPIVNESLLAEFLFTQPFGRLSDPALRERAIVFEPAVDATLFKLPETHSAARKKRLLFYARPTNTRNMFGLGLLALREIAGDPAFQGWEFVSIGGRGAVPPLDLGGGHTLLPAPWVGYADYGNLLRGADVLLCPMLSPHTSYPVLEMAACGGLSVTNSFATKTAARLRALSPQIIATEPSVPGLATGLLQAASQVNAGRPRTALLDMQRDWASVLGPVAKQVAETLDTLTRGSMELPDAL